MKPVALLISAALLLGGCNDAFSPNQPAHQRVTSLAARGRAGEPIPNQ